MNTLLGMLVAGAMAAAPFTLTSTSFRAGGVIGATYAFKGFGCSGDNVSPPLHWSGVPANTRSFALTVWDPDAPVRGGWWHWILFNIPGSVDSLAAGAGGKDPATLVAGSMEGITSFGKPGYGGPCPPTGSGAHHYVFTLYALDTARVRGANAKVDGPTLKALIAKHVLGKAMLIGRFARP